MHLGLVYRGSWPLFLEHRNVILQPINAAKVHVLFAGISAS